MNARTDHVLLEALALAPEERSLVALSLLDSLQGDNILAEDVTLAWVQEAKQRSGAISADGFNAVPLDQMKIWFNTL